MRREAYKQARENLISFMTGMVAKGYRCFINTEDRFGQNAYGIIVLPNHIMSISLDYFEGWHYSICYKPSSKNGSGCRCNDIKVNDLSEETLMLHYHSCLAFARKLDAEFYPTVEKHLEAYMKHYSGQYEEVTNVQESK